MTAIDQRSGKRRKAHNTLVTFPVGLTQTEREIVASLCFRLSPSKTSLATTNQRIPSQVHIIRLVIRVIMAEFRSPGFARLLQTFVDDSFQDRELEKKALGASLKVAAPLRIFRAKREDVAALQRALQEMRDDGLATEDRTKAIRAGLRLLNAWKDGPGWQRVLEIHAELIEETPSYDERRKATRFARI
jgi:hypothetical protein